MGSRFAYSATTGDQTCYYVDGVQQAGGDKVGELNFSKDGSAFAYYVKRGDQCEVIWNNQHLGPYDAVDQVRLSDDGKHIAYNTGKDGQCVVYHDGVAGRPHAKTLDLRISPDGTSTAYIAVIGNKTVLVVGDDYTSNDEKNLLPNTDLAFLDNNRVIFAISSGGQVSVASPRSAPLDAESSAFAEIDQASLSRDMRTNRAEPVPAGE